MTRDELRAWLVNHVATYTKHAPNTIATDTNLSAYGLDSVFVLTLAADIEDYLGIEVEPTLMWDYETIDALSDHLLTLPAAE